MKNSTHASQIHALSKIFNLFIKSWIRCILPNLPSQNSCLIPHSSSSNDTFWSLFASKPVLSVPALYGWKASKSIAWTGGQCCIKSHQLTAPLQQLQKYRSPRRHHVYKSNQYQRLAIKLIKQPSQHLKFQPSQLQIYITSLKTTSQRTANREFLP